MPISSEKFRDALRLFPSGVTLVTTCTEEGQIHGLTVSAFASVSADPPMVTVIIDNKHQICPMLQRHSAMFAVNILAEDQSSLSDRFAFKPGEERFDDGDWSTAITGAPILEDAIAWLDCEVLSRQRAGTHTIYVGEVMDSKVPRPDDAPLLYWNRQYHGVGEIK